MPSSTFRPTRSRYHLATRPRRIRRWRTAPALSRASCHATRSTSGLGGGRDGRHHRACATLENPRRQLFTLCQRRLEPLGYSRPCQQGLRRHRCRRRRSLFAAAALAAATTAQSTCRVQVRPPRRRIATATT
eukprot:264996-Chlamydomonas_euryale.AAC.5